MLFVCFTWRKWCILLVNPICTHFNLTFNRDCLHYIIIGYLPGSLFPLSLILLLQSHVPWNAPAFIPIPILLMYNSCNNMDKKELLLHLSGVHQASISAGRACKEVLKQRAFPVTYHRLHAISPNPIHLTTIYSYLHMDTFSHHPLRC